MVRFHGMSGQAFFIRRTAFGILGLTLAFCLVPNRGVNAARQPPEPSRSPNKDAADRTVWSGIYSEAQALRGKVAYGAACASCHGDNLSGGGFASALVGEEFRAIWDQKKVRALYSRIISTMPENDPGSLSEETVLDMVAYVLQANGFPAGSEPLKRANELNSITFIGKRPESYR